MSAFLYFIPAISGVPSREELRDRGLKYAFPRKQELHAIDIDVGPGGTGGVLFSSTQQGLSYDSKYQKWIKKGQELDVWVGVSRDPNLVPGPGSLTRKNLCIEGHPVELCDGQIWVVPVVRRFPDGSSLPQVVVMSPEGKVKKKVKAEYELLYGLAGALFDGLFESELNSNVISGDDCMLVAELALGINYRLSRYEISLLELIDTDNVKQINEAVIDFPTFSKLMEQQKKKAKVSA